MRIVLRGRWRWRRGDSAGRQRGHRRCETVQEGREEAAAMGGETGAPERGQAGGEETEGEEEAGGGGLPQEGQS